MNPKISNRKLLSEINYSDISLDEKSTKIKDLLKSEQDITITPPFYFDTGQNLHFTGRLYANMNCTFLDYTDIFFGERVIIGPNVSIYTVGHPIEVTKRHIAHKSIIRNIFYLGLN